MVHYRIKETSNFLRKESLTTVVDSRRNFYDKLTVLWYVNVIIEVRI